MADWVVRDGLFLLHLDLDQLLTSKQTKMLLLIDDQGALSPERIAHPPLMQANGLQQGGGLRMESQAGKPDKGIRAKVGRGYYPKGESEREHLRRGSFYRLREKTYCSGSKLRGGSFSDNTYF
jgi:hypothetical protein